MNARLFRSLLILALFPAWALAGNWQIDPAKSRLGFQYKAMGAPLDGEFPQYQADIQLDPAHPERATIRLEVATARIDAGNPDATAEVGSPLFFDSRRYPLARFSSTRVLAQGNGRYLVEGALSIKGITRRVQIPALLKTLEGRQALSGAFSINRLDFRIGEGIWSDTSALANEVRVAFSLQLVPQSGKQ